MKIAVTNQNSRDITAHAGKTSRFLVYTLEANQQVINKEKITLAKQDILHNRFHESEDPYAAHPIFNVDVLITGGAGSGFINRLASQAVKVLITSEKDPDNAIRLLISNKLEVLTPHNHHHN